MVGAVNEGASCNLAATELIDVAENGGAEWENTWKNCCMSLPVHIASLRHCAVWHHSQSTAVARACTSCFQHDNRWRNAVSYDVQQTLRAPIACFPGAVLSTEELRWSLKEFCALAFAQSSRYLPPPLVWLDAL